METEHEFDVETLAPEDSSSQPETTEGKKPRKKRSDAGRRRGPRTTKTKTKADKRKIWLTEAEADYITQGFSVFFAARYGLQTEMPIKEERKHLAAVLRMLEAFAPFAALQALLSRIIPMADPNAKPGGSLFGDLTQYCWAWHERNPNLAMTIYAKEPIPELPMLPKKLPPPQGNGQPRPIRREQITPDNYQSPAARRRAATTNGGTA